MDIAIITTGNEIMSGLTQDTNFSWAAETLTAYSMEVAYHISIGDYKVDIISALDTASRRAKAVIVTGGLGPTDDDITTMCAALYFDVPIKLDEEAYEQIQKRFDNAGREFREIHKKMAYVPTGAKIISNDHGTAPGFSYLKDKTVYFFLPGVPNEFRPMLVDKVIPILEEISPRRERVATRLIQVTGLSESEVAEKLRGLKERGVYLGYRAHFPEIHLRISAKAKNIRDAEDLALGFIEKLKERLGDHIYSVSGKTLEEVVGDMLRKRGMKLALAESCTGGLVASRVTDVAGSSDYFERGIVSYSNESKVEILSVPMELIVKHGAVSAEVVESMARGVRELSRTDIGVGISGIAGPGGGTAEKPVGTVYIGISHKDKGTFSHLYRFFGTRGRIKLATSQEALDSIRKFLINNV